MAWRFKASKYKNAAPIVPKPESCIRDICVGSYQTYGNNIAASAAFMAFNWDHAGSSLAVLPITDCGRKSKSMPLLHAHTDTVTDMDFSPFHDGLLVTGSQDCLMKIWHIPEAGLTESLSSPECTFSHKQRRVEAVGFHPTADCLLHSASFTTLTIWDVAAQEELFSNSDFSDIIQSVSWKRDGSIMSISCKDKMVHIVDPRSDNCISMSASSHQSIKDSRVVWLGDNNKILTTGFDSARLRQIMIRDLRKFNEPEKTLELDCSTGILMPLYDADTGMLFLAGKGDSTISYMEVTDREPYLIEGIRHSGEQTKGACLVPKRALKVMEGEVNRVMQLTSSTVIPIMYQVPRKSYRDYHADLYPDTPGPVSNLTPKQWQGGANTPVPKISLDPAKRGNCDQPIVVHTATFQEICEHIAIANTKVLPISKPSIPITFKPTSLAKPVVEQTPLTETLKDIDQQKLDDRMESIAIDSHDARNGTQNGTVPPKPLPRASRTGSISEGMDEPPRPVARPRTSNTPAATGYKPRLGPKPFSSSGNSAEFSFDKVFQVPAVPGNDTTDKNLSGDTNKSPTSDVEATHASREEDCGNGKSDSSSLEEDANSSDSGYKPKTPSTAERRKLFECRSGSKEEPEDAFELTDDKLGNFERSSAQRNSIAERRRMYESRSQSVQDGPATVDKAGSPTPLRRRDSLKNKKNDETKDDDLKRPLAPVRQLSCDPQVPRKSVDVSPPPQVAPPKRTSTVFGRVSKFRHLKGTPGHKSTHIENVRNISRQISGECDGFQANAERVAVPLSGPGGRIAVFELKRTGKLPDGVIPALVHGSNIMDFQWDPFNNQRLAVACDDGIVRLWDIPSDGLTEPTNTPQHELNAHSDKIYFIKYHPLAQDVLATASYDMSVKIWNLKTLNECISLKGHTEQMFSLSWSPCGQFCATVSKDSKIRVYKPRQSEHPISEGPGPVGSRGARVVWALEGRYLVIMGFDKVSERQVMIFRASDLSTPLNTVGLDVSPAILIPFYEEDSSTLFLTGKGDSTIYAFEVTEEAPFLCPLSHHRCSTLHQGLSFLPKNICDVAAVEFAKAYRLTNNAIESLSFTVPRIKSDLFQDDLFPLTRVTWQPSMQATDWFNGSDRPAQRISLQPAGMDCLSTSQGQAKVVEKSQINKSNSGGTFVGAAQPHNRLGWNAEMSGQTRSKQEEIQRAVSSRMEMNLKLEQDSMEGVDEKEWEP